MTAGLRRDDDEAGAVAPPSSQTVGRYRLVHELGAGGMGVVYLALDPTGRAVAIKVLREHIAYDSEARSRLMREVRTLARVQDARVAAVLDADTEGPRPYIVTRYIPGPCLEEVVSEGGPLTGEALVRLGCGLADALKAIHRVGVIHRDLKPANVVLLDGEPVIIDFGIAHVADDIRLTMTGLVMGTPGYLSPEVVAGAPVTEATDWWGWAATLAFAASGAAPFGRGPMEVVLNRVRHGQADLSGVDQRLVPLLRAALSTDPAERPHADEVVDALARYAVGAPLTLVIPLDGPSSSTRYAAVAPTQALSQGLSQAPVGVGHQDLRESAPSGPAHIAGAWAAPGDEPGQPDPRPGQPDPRIGSAPRSGTLLALAVGVLGVAAIWPVVAIALVVLWCWCARLADLSISSLVGRREQHGRRRRDVPVAILVGPWHLVISAVMVVLALLIPAVVAAGSTFSVALAAAAVSGGHPSPDTSLALVAGGLLGLLMCWWGPGGAGLRRGSRSLVRALAPGEASTALVLATCVLVGAGFAGWAWFQHGIPGWWPLHLMHLPTLPSLFS